MVYPHAYYQTIQLREHTYQATGGFPVANSPHPHLDRMHRVRIIIILLYTCVCVCVFKYNNMHSPEHGQCPSCAAIARIHIIYIYISIKDVTPPPRHRSGNEP